VFVQGVRVDLARLSEVNGTDCVEEAGRVVPSRILNLSTMARVVEEITCPRHTNEPVNGCLVAVSKFSKISSSGERSYKDVAPAGVVRLLHVITEDYL